MTSPGAVPSAERTPWSWLRWHLAEAMGLDFPVQRLADLKRAFAGAVREFGFEDDASGCIRWLATQAPGDARRQVLARHLTVGETYFYRDAPSLDALRSQVLPALVAARRGRHQRIHLWSAACCSGEEAYTLAMLLREAVPRPEGWDLAVLATDINAASLAKARGGCYSEWSFRDAPAWLKPRYFRQQADGLYGVNDDIRLLVRFEPLNLIDLPRQPVPHALVDVIACRNVLMYFTPEHARQVLLALRRCLSADGWLLLGAAENGMAPREAYTPVNGGATILFRAAVAGAAVGDPPVPATAAASPLPPSPTPAVPAAPTPPAARKRAAVTVAAEAAVQARRCADAGRWAEALAWCDCWLVADKMDAAGHYTRGVVLLEQREQKEQKGGHDDGADAFEAARAALQRAVFLDHHFVLAHFALGNLAARLGRADAAARHYANVRRALRRYRHDEVLPESHDMQAGQLAEMLHAMEGAA